MSSQNVSTALVYMAYNTSTGAYVTGDVANHTLKLVKDGTEASPTNGAAEVDSTNCPGAYKLTLTAAETQFGTVWLGGKSSTANVIIIPIEVTFEILPTALDGNGNVKADVVDIAGSAVAPGSAQLGVNVVNIAGQAAALDANNLLKVDVEDIAGNATAGANVSRANRDILRGTCSGGSVTTAICSSISSPASLTDAGQLVGRTIIFDSDTTTTNIQGQASNITNSTTGATPTITFGTMTHAPANGDTFVVL